jgi:hypothetical protein
MRLSLGGEEVAVGEGASVVFDADQDHRYWNASGRKPLAFVMCVVTPPNGLRLSGRSEPRGGWLARVPHDGQRERRVRLLK